MSPGGRWFRVNTTWSQSEWLAALSPAARLAWIELLGYVKAHGYDGRVRSVSPLVFGRMVGIDAADIVVLLEAAQVDGALSVEGGAWVLTGWKEHQGDPTGKERLQRFRKKRSAEDETEETRFDRNATPTETETKTVVKKEAKASSSGSGKPNADPAVREVFDYWRTRCGHQHATLTPERRSKIKARLQTFTVEQLCSAVDGAAESAFHQGDNDRGTRYDFPETIFKNDSAAEKLMHRAGATVTPISNGRGRNDGAIDWSPEQIAAWERPAS